MALNPGDIAFVQYNADGTDDFAFVALVDIPGSEQIFFTDNGWQDTGSFRAGEGIITYTAPAEGLTAGTVVTITINTTPSASVGSVSESGDLNFSGSGDQILAVYEGSDASPTFIAALNNEGAATWQDEATSSNTSALPLGLTNGTNAVAINEIDNAVYTGTTTGDRETLLAALNNEANWSGDDANNQTFSGSFTISGNDTIVVDTFSDENDGDLSAGDVSLREAIAAIASGGTITFDPNLANGTITLSGEELLIDKPLTIDGESNNITIDADNSSRVFNVNDGTGEAIAVEISGLTITGGSITSGSGITTIANDGGGIFNYENLTLTSSTVSGNSADYGGGIFNFNSATVTLSNSTVSGNSASDDGGGILNRGEFISNNSTVSGNSANDDGGGIFNFDGSSTVTLRNSTVSGNSAINDSGGGVYNNSFFTSSNSTISDNIANANGGGIFNTYYAYIDSSTVALNLANYGGGIFNSGLTSLTSTIVANNTANASGGNPDLQNRNRFSALNATNSLIGNDIDQVNRTNENNLSGDAGLDPAGLQDNGGSTQTIALLPTSQAIDAGSNPDGLTTDQRGFDREVGGGLDIGAFELEAPEANDDTFSTDEDSETNGNVISNDTDPNDNSLSIVAVNGNSDDVGNEITLPSGALLTLNSDGTFEYNPNGQFEDLADGQIGSDNFEYTLSNGGVTSTAIATIEIQGVNDAPVVSDSSLSLDENSSNDTVVGRPNVSDPDGDSLEYAIATGNLDTDGDGTPAFTIDPNTGEITVSDSDDLDFESTPQINLSIEVNDGQFAENTTVTVSLNDVNEAPVVNGESLSTDENFSLSGNILANDSDPEGGSLNVTAVNSNAAAVDNQITLPSGALLTLNSDGSFDYDPDGAFDSLEFGEIAPDSFTYTVSDDTGNSNTATVNIIINGISTELVVDTLEDEADGSVTDGDISLRDALAAIAPGGTITFASGLAGGTIELSLGELGVDREVAIDGEDNNIIIDALDNSRVLNIDDGNPGQMSAVLITGLTLSGGSATDNGGGIFNDENLTLTNSTVSGNLANDGGGIFNYSGTVTLTNSTVSGNLADNGGGIFNDSGTVNINNSTVAENYAPNYGGGIFNYYGTANINNSTVALNTVANDGGGIFNYLGTISSTSTIVADNDASGNPDDLFNNSGTIEATSSLIESDTDQLSNTDPSNILGQDPLLNSAGLQDNGGSTLTIALQPNSPAIDAGSNGGFTTDQRGTGFNRVERAQADMGAFERPNDSPNAVGDSVPPLAGSSLNILISNLLANDTDDNGDSLALLDVDDTSSQGGSITLEDNGTADDPSDDFLTYTPASGFVGDDSFTYTIDDGFGGTNTATVNVRVLGNAIAEFGTITNFNHTVQTIELLNDYTNPVVFVQPLSFNGPHEAIGYLTNIDPTNDTFSVRVQEPIHRDFIHTNRETASYFVIEAGTYELDDGTLLEAGTFNTSGGWETVALTADFEDRPTFLSQVQTDNNPTQFVHTRQRNGSAASAEVKLELEERQQQLGVTLESETVGWLAATPGTGNWDGKLYEFGITDEVITDNGFNLDFSPSFIEIPQLLAAIDSFNGTNPAILRYRNPSPSSVELVVQEDQSADLETDHISEAVSYMAIEGEGSLNANSAPAPTQQFIGEFGQISGLTHQAQTIELVNDYDNPVVFALPLSFNGSDPATVRLSAVEASGSSDSFTMQVQEPNYLDGTHPNPETVSYIVLEAGSWELSDGTRLEVGAIEDEDLVPEDNFESISFQTAFSDTPAIFSQVQTFNDPDFVRTRQQNHTSSGFEVGMEEEEARSDSGHVRETIGYWAIETGTGSGTWSGNPYQVGITNEEITEEPFDLSFENSLFGQAPQFFASISTYNDPSSDAAGLRYRSLGASGVRIQIQEDQSDDNEVIRESPEAVNFFALGGESGLLKGSAFGGDLV